MLPCGQGLRKRLACAFRGVYIKPTDIYLMMARRRRKKKHHWKGMKMMAWIR
jgi:hypothetical protein